MIVTTSQLTMTLAPAPHTWGPPTAETAVIAAAGATAEIAASIPDCDWASKFSEVVDSICADYGTDLPSFMSLRWD